MLLHMHRTSPCPVVPRSNSSRSLPATLGALRLICLDVVRRTQRAIAAGARYGDAFPVNALPGATCGGP
jgi:hypothetical protein